MGAGHGCRCFPALCAAQRPTAGTERSPARLEAPAGNAAPRLAPVAGGSHSDPQGSRSRSPPHRVTPRGAPVFSSPPGATGEPTPGAPAAAGADALPASVGSGPVTSRFYPPGSRPGPGAAAAPRRSRRRRRQQLRQQRGACAADGSRAAHGGRDADAPHWLPRAWPHISPEPALLPAAPTAAALTPPRANRRRGFSHLSSRQANERPAREEVCPMGREP